MARSPDPLDACKATLAYLVSTRSTIETMPKEELLDIFTKISKMERDAVATKDIATRHCTSKALGIIETAILHAMPMYPSEVAAERNRFDLAIDRYRAFRLLAPRSGGR